MTKPYLTTQDRVRTKSDALTRDEFDPRGTVDNPLPMWSMTPPRDPHAYVFDPARGLVQRSEIGGAQ